MPPATEKKKAMGKMRNRLGRHPSIYAALAGLGVFSAGLLGTALLASRVEHQELAARQLRVAGELTAIAEDTGALLQKLNAEYRPECSPVNLALLRGVQFGTRFQRDIGLFDAQGRLFCTTALGALPEPLHMDHADVQDHVRGGENRIARLTWFNYRLLVGGGRYDAMIVQQGAFNTVIDPIATSHALGGDVNFIWHRESPDVLYPVRNKGMADIRLYDYLADLARSGAAFQGFSWEHAVFVHSLPVPATQLVVQEYVSLPEAFKDHYQMLVVLAVVSVLLGVLCHAAAAPRFARFAMLEYRIASLVRPEHLLCMYQPIMDLQTGEPIGCEVLMRVRDGKKVLPPDSVLPLIMREGLTWALDRAVIAKGLSELAHYLPTNRPFKVSFNLFPENVRFDILHPLLSRHLQGLDHHGLQIDLEVIEQNYDAQVIEEVGRLKQAGYLVSVDDFGTGFSNLGSVKKFSPTFLKIDKSFVFDMEDASVRSSLIPEIVGIARAVGAQVIAEGVENAAQAEQLRGYGVEFGQGYFFAKPLPIDQFVRFLREALSPAPQPQPQPQAQSSA